MITKIALEVLAGIFPTVMNSVAKNVNLVRPKVSTLFRTSAPNIATAQGRGLARQTGLINYTEPTYSGGLNDIMRSARNKGFVPNGTSFSKAFQDRLV